MCKLNKWFIVKTLVFVSGVLLMIRLGANGEMERYVEIDGQRFKLNDGQTADEFIKEYYKL